MKPNPLNPGFAIGRSRSKDISPPSGMCSLCVEDCEGTCDIALSAVLGSRAVYPTTTGANQIAAEKKYPLDWDSFQINGRVFGAAGCEPTFDEAEIYNVKTECHIGREPVAMTMPLILPALIKLNWQDYFAGAAMAGVACVVGEDAKSKDPDIKQSGGKITDFPMMRRILDSFNRYYRGYGRIFVQCDVEDDMYGVADIAAEKYGAKAIEFKFGQGAKGVQPALYLKDLQEALDAVEDGYLVHPDPRDPSIQKAWDEGVCPNFYKYYRLPQWESSYLKQRIGELRQAGVKNFAFKMAGYDPMDLERIMRMAIECDVDMVTFDSAAGGSGYAPTHMIGEWGLPTVPLSSKLVEISRRLRIEGRDVPAIVLTGGFASEDQIFKALALGGGDITAIGVCRAAMSAAMSGMKIGSQIASGEIPLHLRSFGASFEEIFGDLPDLRALYGREANSFSGGAIGVFSYLNKIAFGLRHFAALNRKFDLDRLEKSDIIPLTADAHALWEEL